MKYGDLHKTKEIKEVKRPNYTLPVCEKCNKTYYIGTDRLCCGCQMEESQKVKK